MSVEYFFYCFAFFALLVLNAIICLGGVMSHALHFDIPILCWLIIMEHLHKLKTTAGNQLLEKKVKNVSQLPLNGTIQHFASRLYSVNTIRKC